MCSLPEIKQYWTGVAHPSYERCPPIPHKGVIHLIMPPDHRCLERIEVKYGEISEDRVDEEAHA